jgi:sterol 24-C-methyltransferase
MIYPAAATIVTADLIYIYLNKIDVSKSFEKFINLSLNDKVVIGSLAGSSALLTILTINKLFGDIDPLGRTGELLATFARQENKRNIEVGKMIDTYNNLHDDKTAGVTGRNESYTTLVNAYYELATLFYEWGWGQSFHFAYKLKGETFQSSIARHEYYLAGRLGVKTGDKLLDCGCGIGGPMRNIARFTRANIRGVTLNEVRLIYQFYQKFCMVIILITLFHLHQYQVIRGNELNKAQGLSDLAVSIQADFMKLPFEANYFDGVYAIEATCHAPRREDVYGEIFRVLKPGQIFACYEWCLTPLYDKANEYHRQIKKKIEEGDGLPDMATQVGSRIY